MKATKRHQVKREYITAHSSMRAVETATFYEMDDGSFGEASVDVEVGMSGSINTKSLISELQEIQKKDIITHPYFTSEWDIGWETGGEVTMKYVYLRQPTEEEIKKAKKQEADEIDNGKKTTSSSVNEVSRPKLT